MTLLHKTTDPVNYKCACCGQEYGEMPLCFGAEFPDYYFSVPPDERESRIQMTESLCAIDGTHFFHRGRITIPIKDYKDDLLFDVWTTISEANFFKRDEMWEDPQRIHNEPYFGWLQTVVPGYDKTISIKTMAYESEMGMIPAIKVTEEDHPLTLDQENGISFEEAVKRVDNILKQFHQ